MVPLLIAGASAVASLASSYFENKAQEAALTAQASAYDTATQQNTLALNQRFSDMQTMLEPYTTAGSDAMTQMNALSGASGANAQAAAMQGIQDSEMFQSLVAQGENSILQNASATGGLRGGNTQGALAQFAPQMLSDQVQQQYSNLSGLASMGMSAESQLGTAGMNLGTQLANMSMQNAGMQGQLEGFNNSQGYALGSGITNALGTGLGTYTGLGGDFGLAGNQGVLKETAGSTAAKKTANQTVMNNSGLGGNYQGWM